ncbi:FkbM family methyltransferase [Spirosoma spitsbergense]|uniref:FkbM family methyltransferase n=1 Tax=Spirosoma spitsbergense TaxID=431554 RepID=UPI0003A3BAC8|nr:FkbM family methyltransferase [Spirosoma spitsbergense]
MKTIKCLFKQFNFSYAIQFGLLEFVRRIVSKDSYLAYSQTGEDIIIKNILQTIENGFYVEVGSNEPIQHSNTFKLYQQGWHGITIDANSKMVSMHKKIRPNDIAVCAAVSDEAKNVTFYEFDMDEISTIDADFYNKHKDTQRVKIKTTLKTKTLNSILQELLPAQTSIDLLSIDVEGHDYNVLNSIDLRKYRPKLIVIEMHSFNISNPMENPVYKKMLDNDYLFTSYATWNGYFIAKEFLSNE